MFWQVRRICLSPTYKSDYEALFDLGYESADELQQQYAAAFGSSYDAMDPTLANLFATVEADDRNFDYEKDICSGVSLFHTMGLDMVRRSRPRNGVLGDSAPSPRTSAGDPVVYLRHPRRHMLERGHRRPGDLPQQHRVAAPRRPVLV